MATKPGAQSSPPDLRAARFVERLEAHRSPEEREKYQRYFKTRPGEYAESDTFMGVRMGTVFELAKEFEEMPPNEIERLLEEPMHEARAGAVRIMARQAANRKTTGGRRRELYELYLRRHDRINNWDLVDLGAWEVVGRFLVDKPREVLYELARSSNLWERRTAILSTLFFVRQGDLDDTFHIAGMLLGDSQDLIHKAAGWALRETGGKDRERLLAFLDKHAATMPRTTLRYATEHLDKDQRADYLAMASSRRQSDGRA